MRNATVHILITCRGDQSKQRRPMHGELCTIHALGPCLIVHFPPNAPPAPRLGAFIIETILAGRSTDHGTRVSGAERVIQRAAHMFVWLGYGCAILWLVFGGNVVGCLMALALQIAGLAWGIIILCHRRRLNGAAIPVISVVLVCLSAIEFRRDFREINRTISRTTVIRCRQWAEKLRQK
jgi:hypothetical protein